MEKRIGRREIEVTRRRKGGFKRRETDPASNQFPRCSPQPRTHKEIHRVRYRKENREEGDRSGQEHKGGNQKERDRSSQ